MSSTIFTYSPTSGSGDTSVYVGPTERNTGSTDSVSTIVFTSGSASKSVTLTHRYKPWYEPNVYTTFPASGGTTTFTVHTDYPICFSGTPEWLTFTSGSTDYSDGTIIQPSVADNGVFTITAAPNQGAARSNGINIMAHYINGSVGSWNYRDRFFVNQESGTPEYATVVINVTASDIPLTGTYGVDVLVGSYDGEQDSASFTLSNSVTGGSGSVSVKLNPTGSTTLAIDVTPSRQSGILLTLEADITLDYGTDSFYEGDVDLGDTAIFQSTYQEGEEIILDLAISLINP